MTEEEEIAEEVRRRRKEREEAKALRQRMQAQFEQSNKARRDHQAEEERVDKMTAKIPPPRMIASTSSTSEGRGALGCNHNHDLKNSTTA